VATAAAAARRKRRAPPISPASIGGGAVVADRGRRRGRGGERRATARCRDAPRRCHWGGLFLSPRHSLYSSLFFLLFKLRFDLLLPG
jgi:hypothetical protein